jgi:hypothetical protein
MASLIRRKPLVPDRVKESENALESAIHGQELHQKFPLARAFCRYTALILTADRDNHMRKYDDALRLLQFVLIAAMPASRVCTTGAS